MYEILKRLGSRDGNGTWRLLQFKVSQSLLTKPDPSKIVDVEEENKRVQCGFERRLCADIS